MYHTWATAAVAFLVLGAGAALHWRALGARGRSALVAVTLLAWPVAVYATVATVDPERTLPSPTTSLVVWLHYTSFLVVLAAFVAVARRITWEGRGWWFVALPLGIFMATGLLAGATGRPAFWGFSPLAWASAAALWPAAAGHAFDRTAPAPRWSASVGALLILALDVALVPLGWGALFEGPTEATHAWHVQLEPQGQGPYAIEVPFLAADGPHSEATRGLMLEGLAVAMGSGTVRLAGDRVIVEGSGRIVVTAAASFYGTVEHREAFHDYRIGGMNVTLSPGGPTVGVTWQVAFSGGQGHTCQADAKLTATVPPGESLRLEGGDRLLEREGIFRGECQ